LTPTATNYHASAGLEVEREPGERPGQAPRALGEALRAAEPFLRSVALRLCRNGSDAKDLVQDTFERALRSGGEPPRNPRAWLATILHNLFVDRCRALARRPAPESLDERHTSDAGGHGDEPEPAWSRVTIADVRAALDEIEPGFRRTYELHVFEHRSYDEIAAELRIQRVTVGTRLNRARHQLRAVLHRRLGEESDP
jgi:RNA polymerase sigma-70 factor (ECF subfamily)